jgi:5-carboxymethyl-2-hydroxymuconic-semialdehyde dehydrogenase
MLTILLIASVSTNMSEFESNLCAAEGFLEKFKSNITGHFINGSFVVPDGTELFENTSPVDQSSLGQVAIAGEAEVDQACGAAEAAFPAWRDTPGGERKVLLHHFADKIVERADEIALVESMDCGQPIKFMKKAAIRGAANFRYFADKAPEATAGSSSMQEEHTNFTSRSPIGAVGIITPWNTPFMLSTWKIAPALASGCTVVHKPAELSPLTAMLLAEIARDAGIPDGVWNTINGYGQVAGKRLTEHPAIKAVALVGSSITGPLIMKQGADTLKRMHLELGGKNPVIVFDDADFERALDAVVFMIYSLNGERCTSSSRLLVQSGIKPKFLAALAKRVANIRVGHPLDPATEVGPMIGKVHYAKVNRYFDIAERDGAQVLVGGKPCETPSNGDACGNYVEPTLFVEAKNEMRIAQEEIFGPVLTAIEFDSEEQAIEIANDIQFGLAGYIWTNDTGRAMRLSRKIEAGMLWINSENNRNLPSPFGGVKMSGIGRDGGDYSFDFYMETKNVCVALGTHKIPVLGGFS